MGSLLIYLLGYGLGRFWIEGLRTDQLLLPKVGLPVSQLLAGTIVVISAILIIAGRKKQQLHKNSPAAANKIEYRKKIGMRNDNELDAQNV